MMASLNPMHEVLAIPELLENIFIQLPLRSVFIAQGVCHFWKAAIESSPSLQRDPFRAIIPTEVDSGKDLCSDAIINPIVHDATMSAVAARLNSSLMHYAWHNKEASWRDLQLFHPPRAAVYFMVQDAGSSCTMSSCWNKTGVTLEEFVHMVSVCVGDFKYRGFKSEDARVTVALHKGECVNFSLGKLYDASWAAVTGNKRSAPLWESSRASFREITGTRAALP